MISQAVLEWYDQERRAFPWRSLNGFPSDPYHVWISEIMLQQTTTATVEPYFKRFIEQWPTVRSLTESSLDDVLHAWQGLGYYSRARNLHLCAKTIINEYKGQLPFNEDELLKLPGIGPYTAAAIVAIAYDHPSAPVDGNIARIFSRLYALEEMDALLTKQVKQILATTVPEVRNGDYVQALMDIGATICLPKYPRCEICPLSTYCTAHKTGSESDYPKKKPKVLRPVKQGYFFWIEDAQGRVWLRKRPHQGLLGGMMEIPSTPWQEDPLHLKDAMKHLSFSVEPTLKNGSVEHTFTHFHLSMKVIKGKLKGEYSEGLWVHPNDFKQYALPTLMKKAIKFMLLEDKKS